MSLPYTYRPMVVGIDFDTNAIYLCALDVDNRDHVPIIDACQLRTSKGDLVEAIAAVPLALTTTLHRMGVTAEFGKHARPDAWVERGTGASRVGDWPLGAIAGAIISAWPRVTNGGGVRVIKTADWKKAIGAPGNCGKPIANHYATLQWRSRYPDVHPPTNHNELDAYSIAVTASTL